MTMFGSTIFLLLSVSCFYSAEATNPPPTCTPAYLALSQHHTMCRTDSERVIDWGVPAADIQIILDTHNDFRASVDPPARDMPKLYWDPEVAALADKWAKDCWGGHDLASARTIPGYPHIGQNMARIPGADTQWAKAIGLWYNETKDFVYGEGAKEEGDVIGHYTQVVLAGTVKIGCGFANCGRSYQYYICNYVRGQMTVESNVPYFAGETCSSCPKSCKGGLCDCDGLLCLNGGTYDVNECTCTCAGPWKGEDCGELDCPLEDPQSCNGKTDWHCKTFSNYKTECPYLCGPCNTCDKTCQNGGVIDPETCKCDCGNFSQGDTCEEKIAPCNGKVCQNGGKLNTMSCTCVCSGWFEGETCDAAITTTTPAPLMVMQCPPNENLTMLSPEKCKDLPSEGVDHAAGICESNGGSYGCSKCVEWKSWFPHQYCPVMCGLCEPPCQGKVCHYGGTLGADCKCTCPTKTQHFEDPFLVTLGGDLCEKVECPDDSVTENTACTCPWFTCDSDDDRFRCPFSCKICRRS